MASGRVAVIACTWLVAACTGPSEEMAPSIAPPACTAIASFGNGATCSLDEPSMITCGKAKSRACASGWLCFDAPEYVDCACATDADCEPRSAYINAARTAAGKAPLKATCDDGRCAGKP